jgi:hypothetical protein
MGRRSQTVKSEVVLYDVLYEDGTRSSNRKVSSSELSGPDAEAAARAALEAQDRKVGEASGMPRPRIKSISKSKGR